MTNTFYFAIKYDGSAFENQINLRELLIRVFQFKEKILNMNCVK